MWAEVLKESPPKAGHLRLESLLVQAPMESEVPLPIGGKARYYLKINKA